MKLKTLMLSLILLNTYIIAEVIPLIEPCNEFDPTVAEKSECTNNQHLNTCLQDFYHPNVDTKENHRTGLKHQADANLYDVDLVDGTIKNHGQTHSNGFCSKKCYSSDDCPDTLPVCTRGKDQHVPYGVCGRCLANSQCDDGKVCYEGSCLNTCSKHSSKVNNECPSTMNCKEFTFEVKYLENSELKSFVKTASVSASQAIVNHVGKYEYVLTTKSTSVTTIKEIQEHQRGAIATMKSIIAGLLEEKKKLGIQNDKFLIDQPHANSELKELVAKKSLDGLYEIDQKINYWEGRIDLVNNPRFTEWVDDDGVPTIGSRKYFGNIEGLCHEFKKKEDRENYTG